MQHGVDTEGAIWEACQEAPTGVGALVLASGSLYGRYCQRDNIAVIVICAVLAAVCLFVIGLPWWAALLVGGAAYWANLIFELSRGPYNDRAAKFMQRSLGSAFDEQFPTGSVGREAAVCWIWDQLENNYDKSTAGDIVVHILHSKTASEWERLKGFPRVAQMRKLLSD